MKKKNNSQVMLLVLLILLLIGSLAMSFMASPNPSSDELSVASQISAKSGSNFLCANVGGIWCYWPSWALVINTLWIGFLVVLIILLLKKILVG